MKSINFNDALLGCKRYNALNAEQLQFISNLNAELEKCKINNYYNHTVFLKLFLKEHSDFMHSNKKYLLECIFDNSSNYKYFQSFFLKKKISFISVNEWKVFLKEKSIKIDFLKSFIVTFLFSYKQVLKSFYFLFKSLINFSNNKFNNLEYIYFANLEESCIPINSRKKDNFTIIDWYIENYKNNDFSIKVDSSVNELTTYKNRKIMMQKNFFNSISLLLKLKFLCLFLIIFFESVFFYFIGKKNYLFFLPEITKYLYFSLMKDEDIPKEIYFSQSDYKYRPLWTYAATSKGSKVILYFYAASFDGYLVKEKVYNKIRLGYSNMDWPTVLIWSKDLKNFLENLSPKSYFKLTNPIYFSDIKKNQKLPNDAILVFDITPKRPYFRFLEFQNNNYVVYKNLEKFLLDIISICNKNNFNVVLKPHKNFEEKYYDTRYKNFLRKHKKNIFILDSKSSPHEIIKKYNFSISFPWTSTPLISDFYNKKCIYYDASGTLSSTDRGRQGTEFVNNEKDLEELIKKYYIK
jgi:polysaccharide biosynthesis PFTS motif protein